MNTLKNLTTDINKLKSYLIKSDVLPVMLESPGVIEYIIRKIEMFNVESIPIDKYGNIIFAGSLKQTSSGFVPIRDNNGNYDVIIIPNRRNEIEINCDYSNINYKERVIIDSNFGITKAYCIFNTIEYLKVTRMPDLTIKVERFKDEPSSISTEFIFDNGNPSNLLSNNSFEQNFIFYTKNYSNLINWYETRFKNCTFDVADYSNFALPMLSLPFWESILKEKLNIVNHQREIIEKLENEFLLYISKISNKIKKKPLSCFLYFEDIEISTNKLEHDCKAYCTDLKFEVSDYNKKDYHDEVLKVVRQIKLEIDNIDEIYKEEKNRLDLLEASIPYLKLAFNTKHTLFNGNKIKRILNGVSLLFKDII